MISFNTPWKTSEKQMFSDVFGGGGVEKEANGMKYHK